MRALFTNVLRSVLGSVLGSALIGLSLSQTAQAQPEGFCDDPGVIPAADTTRDLELEQFGLDLTIPENYRAILRNDGSVEIVDPGTYELIVCIAQGGDALGRGYAATTVDQLEAPADLDLQQFVEEQTRLQGEISPHPFNGEQGYLVESRSDYGAEFWVELEEVPGVVKIARSCDCPGMRDNLITLLERSNPL